MARHPLEAERSRHQCLDHRRRRSGVEPLRRPTPERPRGRASRLAGPIRLAKEFGSPGRFVPGDTRESLGPRRRHGRRHPGATTAQRSLWARQYPPVGAIRLGSKVARRPDRDHGRPPRVRRRVFQLPLRFHQSDLLPRAGGQRRGRLHLQLASQPVGRRGQGEFRIGGLFQGRRFRFEHRLPRHDAQPRLFGQPSPARPKAPSFPPNSRGRQNSMASRGATSLEVGGATMGRRMSRPASMESRSWCQDCPGFTATDATGFPPCCSSNSPVLPTTRTRRTTG